MPCGKPIFYQSKQCITTTLYSFVGTLVITGASIGRCCRMSKIGGCANVNQHVCAIRLYDATETKAGVLTAILESSIGQHQIALLNAGGNREGLNYQQVRSFLVPWPRVPEEFDRLYRVMEIMIDDIHIWQSSSEKLRVLKSGLMQDLLTARRQVTVLATDVALQSQANG